MGIVNYLKNIKTNSNDLLSETAEIKKNWDKVKFELDYARLIMKDIQKDIKTYQFQSQPRIKVISGLVTKIQNERLVK
jgi:hypothetical protein